MNTVKEIISDNYFTYSRKEKENLEKFCNTISYACDRKYIGCRLIHFIHMIENQLNDGLEFGNYSEKWFLYYILPRNHFIHEKHYFNFHNVIVVTESQKGILDDNEDNYDTQDEKWFQPNPAAQPGRPAK